MLKPQWEATVIAAKHRGVSLGRWKLLLLPTPQGTRVELYDAWADPQNLRDVAALHPDIVGEMRARLASDPGTG